MTIKLETATALRERERERESSNLNNKIVINKTRLDLIK